MYEWVCRWKWVWMRRSHVARVPPVSCTSRGVFAYLRFVRSYGWVCDWKWVMSHVCVSTVYRLQFYHELLEGCWRIWGPWGRRNECVIQSESCHTFVSPTLTSLYHPLWPSYLVLHFQRGIRVSKVRKFVSCIWGSWSCMNQCVMKYESCHTFCVTHFDHLVFQFERAVVHIRGSCSRTNEWLIENESRHTFCVSHFDHPVLQF